MKIAVLMTCHNRQEKTLSCLHALVNSEPAHNAAIEVFLVDDGSTDGTDLAVRDLYPHVNIIKGDGNLFWNGGMRVAFDAALEKGYDYYLWLNDDTLLYPTAIQKLIEVAEQLSKQQGKGVIVVGATQDETTGNLTYGGVTRPQKWKPTSFKLVPTSAKPVECDTMNGNCVLISAQIANAIGGMEPAYSHAMGDTDYGLRARAAGFSVWVMPGFAGTCARNPTQGSFNDTTLPVTVRMRKMLHTKGLPFSSWRVFTRRHAGFFWPLYCLWPYAKVIMSGMFRR